MLFLSTRPAARPARRQHAANALATRGSPAASTLHKTDHNIRSLGFRQYVIKTKSKNVSVISCIKILQNVRKLWLFRGVYML